MDRFLPTRTTYLRTGACIISHVSFPVDVERPARGPHLPGRHSPRCPAPRLGCKSGYVAGPELGVAHVSSFSLDGIATRGLLRPAALLRARHSGRVGEGLSKQR